MVESLIGRTGLTDLGAKEREGERKATRSSGLWHLLAPVVLAFGCCACTPGPTFLAVDLRTDLSPGLEFDRVAIRFFQGSSLMQRDLRAPDHRVSGDDDTLGGLRIAEMSLATPGTWTVQTRLLLGSQLVGGSILLVDLSGEDLAITARVTRDCAGVSCPGDGAPNAIACLGGACVDPRCSPESPEFCPDSECGDDSACSPAGDAPSCGVGRCLLGVCTTALDDSMCEFGPCRPQLGCALAEEVVQVSAGSGFTCALRAGGDVLCWGRNGAGELGDGGNLDRSTPALVLGLNDAVEIQAGGRHTCARRQNGAVVCWGRNDNRQVDAGETTFRSTPVAVPDIDDAVALSAGGGHSCALRSTGQVYCWGNNFYGQIGSNDGTDGRFPTPVLGPEGEALLSDAVALIGSGSHNCVQRESGETFCWGNNDTGQFGDGNVMEGPAPEPTAMHRPAGEEGPREFEAPCIRDPDGTAAPAESSHLCDAVRITAGGRHTCLVRASGELYCSGRNVQGELGIGSVDSQSLPTLVSLPPEAIGAHLVQLDAGNNHSCGRTSTGQIFCWGDNAWGQIGDDSNVDRSTPMLAPAIDRAVDISAGFTHTCALQAGGESGSQVLCWGSNSAGQIGHAEIEHNATPTPVSGVGVITQMTGGLDHSCVLEAAGTVSCWGANYYGQLGDGAFIDRSSPAPVPGVSGIISLDAGGYFTCALRADGSVMFWGVNFRTQSGDGVGGHRPTATTVLNLDDAVQLSAGWRHVCAVRATGELVCWGANESGQIGDGGLTQRGLPFTIPGITDAVAVSASWRHSCVVRATGEVACWGSNASGQSGGGSGPNVLAPRLVGGISDATTVASGRSFSCALRATGQVACWGGNSLGMLGIGADQTIADVAQTIPDLSDIVELWAGSAHVCARSAVGDVFCWGNGTEGQLGNGMHDHAYSPVPLPSLSNMTSLALGGEHACAIDSTGALLCWGDGSRGELGYGPSWTPRIVEGL